MTHVCAGFRLGLLTALLLLCSSGSRAQDGFFAADKGLHFGLSAAAALTNYVVLDSLELNAAVRYPLLLALPLALGFGKELLDVANGGLASRADLAWDIVGVATGLALGYALREWLFPGPAQPNTAQPLLLLGEVAPKRY
jgi:uncharacterized protein YfiM (DUF2279 family)